MCVPTNGRSREAVGSHEVTAAREGSLLGLLEFFGVLVSLAGVLEGLLRELVGGEVVVLGVGGGGLGVSLGGEVVEFGGAIVYGLGHGCLLC
jgi:hypothetical protein